jgi:hypothetical protein
LQFSPWEYRFHTSLLLSCEVVAVESNDRQAEECSDRQVEECSDQQEECSDLLATEFHARLLRCHGLNPIYLK